MTPNVILPLKAALNDIVAMVTVCQLQCHWLLILCLVYLFAVFCCSSSVSTDSGTRGLPIEISLLCCPQEQSAVSFERHESVRND